MWQRVKDVPKLKDTYRLNDYYAWYDRIECVMDITLDSWEFATGSILYPSIAECDLVKTGNGHPTFPALRSISEDGLDYIMTRLPKLRGQDNYVEWRGGMRAFMDARGLYGYLDGSIPRPTEGETQSLNITPTLSSSLEEGLKNWRQGKLDNLLDDQKVWLLVDKLTLCAIYFTCSPEIQRSLSHRLERDELQTSRDVLQYIVTRYAPSQNPTVYISELGEMRRQRYTTFQEFAATFINTIRACEAAGTKIPMTFVAMQFCTALGSGDGSDATRQAILRFMDEHKKAGRDMDELKLRDIIAIAQRMDETYKPPQVNRRNRNRNRNRNRGGHH